jgi:rod shape-determining protein MreD
MRWPAYFILAYLALGVQIALTGFVDVRGVEPNVVLLVVVFLALNGTREAVLLGAFLLGLMQDLLTLQPMGTWAFSYGLVAMSVLSTQEIVYRDHPMTHFFLALSGGIMCGVVLTVHGWIYPLLHGGAAAPGGGSAATHFGAALYTALLAPVVLGVLQRAKGVFGFRRRN